MKKFRYIIEAILVRTLIALFGCLSPARASALGGFLGRSIGPHLAVSRKKAARHIMASLNTSPAATREIIRAMWDNLGRTFAEYPHLHTITSQYTTISGIEHIDSILKNNGPAIFFSGHLANWEAAGASIRRFGVNVDLIYRAPNNPYVRDVLDHYRSMGGELRTYPKSASGMRQVMMALKEGRRIGILIDQKYNQGVEADFFGQPAMTSLSFIQLARKFNCPLIPTRVERLPHAHFHVTFYPPLDTSRDDSALLREAHDMLESWIRHKPGHWLWLHKRWKNT